MPSASLRQAVVASLTSHRDPGQAIASPPKSLSSFPLGDHVARRYGPVAMPMPGAVREDAVRQVGAFCDRRVPVDLRGELRLEHAIRRNRITIVERRPPWSELVGPDWTSTNVAQLRYDEHSDSWTLYAADRNDRWFLYDDVGRARDVGPLLAEIDEDPTAIFWG